MRPLPFSAGDFLDVFRRYNEGVGPVVPVVLTSIALAAVFIASMRRQRGGHRAVLLLLAVLWAWSGAAYHLAYFRQLTPGALLFGALFLAQAALLARAAVLPRGRRWDFGPPAWDLRTVIGAIVIAYALLGYPLVGRALGHLPPHAPTFGVPCPVTLFTLGLFAWARPAVPGLLLGIPLLWALIGTSAALQLGMREDLGLTIAALAVALLWWGARRASASIPAFGRLAS